jgi:hypothetical protein
MMAQSSGHRLVVKLLYLGDGQVSRLFDLGNLYVLNLATEGLVEIPDESTLHVMLGPGNSTIHGQDIFVLSSTASES